MKKLTTLSLGILISVTVHAGLLDTSFNPGTGAGGGIVEQVLPLSSGKILACGNFTSFNGRSRAYIVRLNSDGSVDESFYAQPGYWVRHMSVQSDGKIVIGGYFTTVQGQPRNLIARLNPDGSLDTSFNVGSGATVIIAGGIDGNMDPFVFWNAVQPDGKIIITGNFRYYNGASSQGIARLNPDGSRDTSFNVGAGLDSWGRHILVQPNGQILLSGWFTSYNNQGFNRLVRLNPDGNPDNSFNPYFGDKTAIYCTALVGGGKMIASGHSLNDQGLFKREFERLNSDGSVDGSFVGSSNDKTESLAIQSDGRVIIAGSFSYVDNTPRTCLARLNPDGTLDSSFQVNIDNFVWSAVLQGDGKLLIGGGFYNVDGVSRVGVARILTGSSAPPPPSDTPPTLNISGVTSSSITLSWSDSLSRNSYGIEEKFGGSYSQIAAVGSGVRSYTVSGLSPSTTYFFRIKAVNSSGGVIYSNESGATTSAVSGGGGGGANSAAFAGADANTYGSWKGVYGSEGYNVIGDSASYPGYVQVTPIGKSDWVWQYSTANAAAVQRANSGDRIAACWYSPSSYSIDFRFLDSNKHRVAFYFLDWDLAGRNQTVQVTDGDSGAILESRAVSNFGNGIYFIWDLGGHVKVTITPQNVNGVLSGIFFGGGGGGGGTSQSAATPVINPNGGTFSSAQQVSLSTATAGAEIHYTFDGTDPTTSNALYTGPFTVSSTTTVKAKAFKSGYLPSGTAAATFTIGSSSGGGARVVFAGADSTTRGNWRGVYGTEGYNVIGKATSYPAYAQVTPAGKSDWVWNDPTSDPRGLQTPSGTSRIGACWYSGGSFDVDLNFTDGRTHRLSIYFCDWDYAGRSETVQVIDAASGAILQSRSVSGFSGGQYLSWDMKGRIKLRFSKSAGPNSIINGLFFQAAGQQL